MKHRTALCLLIGIMVCLAAILANADQRHGSPILPLKPEATLSQTPIHTQQFKTIARELIDVSPDGLAIGEVHGQIEGIEFMRAAIDVALETHDRVLLLLEITPEEAGLDIDQIIATDFILIDMSDMHLPFWTENLDKRASWELYEQISELRDMPRVEISYLWDPRLYGPPNFIKAHGLARRWHIVQEARPRSYIISLMGNLHTSKNYKYPLAVTNSLCRYLLETHEYAPTCLRVDHDLSSRIECPEGVRQQLFKGSDVFEDYDYVVHRSDRCTRKATWVGAN
ncbi:MAG: hypothetical protein AAFP97_10950 [Pseudomonadota bacterium]